MENFYQQVLELLASGRPLVSAMIVRRQGSAPRALGSKLLLEEDGRFRGSVGGGLLEAHVLAEGRQLFRRHQATLLCFDLMGRDAESAGMICGGVVDVYLEYLDPKDSDLVAFIRRLADLVKVAEPASLALALDEDRPWGRRFLVTRQEALALPASPWPEALVAWRDSFQEKGLAIRPGLLEGFFIEPLEARATVFIFGGGHISLQTAALAALVDFRVVVVDDRQEFASARRFPMADEVHCRPFAGACQELKIGPQSFVVIVTRGHTWDSTVLAEVLRTEAAYIGMIGSRRKRDTVFELMLKQGFSRADLARVHSPIGLDIGAETPEEIAISIIAELIKVRAGLAGSRAVKDWKV